MLGNNPLGSEYIWSPLFNWVGHHAPYHEGLIRAFFHVPARLVANFHVPEDPLMPHARLPCALMEHKG